jgi:hypothetical protein
MVTPEAMANTPANTNWADAQWIFQAGNGKPFTRACSRVCQIHRWTYDHDCVGHNSF